MIPKFLSEVFRSKADKLNERLMKMALRDAVKSMKQEAFEMTDLVKAFEDIEINRTICINEPEYRIEKARNMIPLLILAIEEDRMDEALMGMRLMSKYHIGPQDPIGGVPYEMLRVIKEYEDKKGFKFPDELHSAIQDMLDQQFYTHPVQQAMNREWVLQSFADRRPGDALPGVTTTRNETDVWYVIPINKDGSQDTLFHFMTLWNDKNKAQSKKGIKGMIEAFFKGNVPASDLMKTLHEYGGCHEEAGFAIHRSRRNREIMDARNTELAAA